METNEIARRFNAIQADLPANPIVDELQDCFEAAMNRIAALESQLADRDAEIERLRADLVWAVRHGASEGYDGNSDPCIWYSGIERHRDVLCSRELSVDIDGTSDSICLAVREARDGVS